MASGLFATDADARRACMRKPYFLKFRSLQWHLRRKAAVLEAGGSLADCRAAYYSDGSIEAALPCLLLFQHTKCASSHVASHHALSLSSACVGLTRRKAHGACRRP